MLRYICHVRQPTAFISNLQNKIMAIFSRQKTFIPCKIQEINCGKIGYFVLRAIISYITKITTTYNIRSKPAICHTCAFPITKL